MVEGKKYEGRQFGEYRLLRWLGGGGFGDVYLGEHVRDHNRAAVKVLQMRFTQNQGLQEFINEARTMRLVHPNIIHVLDFGIDTDGTPFVVMEYAPHGTLRDRHPHGTSISLTTSNIYVEAMASALQYAHEHHSIHRDVKPENMLIGAHQQLWLSDFGIAAVVRSSYSLSTQGMSGTISYMAPEQIQGKPCPASDQYSLAIAAYEWLTGRYPFTGTAMEIITQHMAKQPEPLTQFNPGLSAQVSQVILTALEKEPSKRFATIQAFASALRQASEMTPDFSVASSVTLSPFSERSTTTLPFFDPLPHPEPPAPTTPLPSTSPLLSRRTIVAGGILVLAAISGAGYVAGMHPFARPIATIQTGNKNLLSNGHPLTPVPSPTPSLPIGKHIYTYRGHKNYVYTLQWSADDQRLVSSSEDGTVQVWDAATGNHAYVYRGHTDRTNEAVWSPDNKWIASAASDATVQIWDAVTGALRYTYTGHVGPVFAVAWSPDGKRIASGGLEKTVHVWNATNGQHLYTYLSHTDTINKLAWSPDSKRIVSGSTDTTAQVWNADDGSNAYLYSGHASVVYRVAWSPAGTHIASTSYDKTVHVWSPIPDIRRKIIYGGHTGPVMDCAWSPDSTRIVSASVDRTAQIWTIANAETIYTYTGHSGGVFSIAWSHAGRYIATGSDISDPTAQVWTT